MTSPSTSKNSLTEESLGIQCWIKFTNQWTKALYTPFLVCLSAGNLHVDAFRNFLAQNLHFLRAFEQAYEMAEKYTDDENAKVVIRKMRESVLGEIKMHASPPQVLEEWGVSLPEESIPSPATVKYTKFLLETASGNIHGVPREKFETPFEKTKLPAYTFGAMAPLMRLYTFLGKELQTLEGAREGVDPIQKWINKCSSQNFHEATLQTEGLLDQLSASFTGEELNMIEKLYGQAIELETEFFLAHTPTQGTVVPLSREHNPDEHRLLLFSDFDLTCTVLDSSAILTELAIITALKLEAEGQLVPMPSADLRRTLEEFSDQYTEEYKKCLETILAPNKGKMFDYEGLHKALEQVSEFEKQANTRVIHSDVLKGLNVDVIREAGESLLLQDGCTNFFQSIVNYDKLNTKIHIISDSWCDDLIKSCFASGGLGSVDMNIHANEFVYEDSLSTGEIYRKVESPIDKVQAFSDILEKSPDDRKNLTVYIGDSVGDLLCLLKADVGIVIGSSSESLKKVASQFGVSFIPLWRGAIKKQKSFDEGSSDWKGSSGVLYTVSSWAEIHSFVLGL